MTSESKGESCERIHSLLFTRVKWEVTSPTNAAVPSACPVRDTKEEGGRRKEEVKFEVGKCALCPLRALCEIRRRKEEVKFEVGKCALCPLRALCVIREIQ